MMLRTNAQFLTDDRSGIRFNSHMQTHYRDDMRRVAAHAQAQANKQAALDLFYRIMSAEGETLLKACKVAGLDTASQSEDELRRRLLAWHRQRHEA